MAPAAGRYFHLVPEQLQEKIRLLSPLAGVEVERQCMISQSAKTREVATGVRLTPYAAAELDDSCGMRDSIGSHGSSS